MFEPKQPPVPRCGCRRTKRGFDLANSLHPARYRDNAGLVYLGVIAQRELGFGRANRARPGEAKRHQALAIAVPQCVAQGLQRRAQRKR